MTQVRVQGFIVVALVLGVGLAACSQTNNQAGAPSPAANPEIANAVTPTTLTPAQSKVVEDGVKVMIANPETAKFSAKKAVSLAGKPGIHVCGFVSHKAAGGRTPELPFYIELRDQNGAPAAYRGQVGSDDSKRAKVKFVCRHSGA
ncbi:MAG: hypothetical protein ACRBCJ_05535 [Hyphomicrobiaceae bacterium]